MCSLRPCPSMLCLVILLLLTSCSAFSGEEVTAESIMEKEGAPEIETVEGALYKSAESAEKSKDYKRAVGMYEQLVTKAADKKLYEVGLANAVRLMGDYDRAERIYVLLSEKYPEDLHVKEGYGLTLLSLGEVDKAMDVLSDVLGKDRERWKTLNGLGIALSMKQDFGKALGYYQEALKLNAKNPSILNNVGLTMAIRGDYEKSIKALELAARQLPKNSLQREQIDLNQALVYGISGDMRRAEESAKHYLDEHELYNNLGFYAFLSENTELSRTYLNMALTGSAEHYEKAWQNLSNVDKKKVKRPAK